MERFAVQQVLPGNFKTVFIDKGAAGREAGDAGVRGQIQANLRSRI
jgi:hypothetical protein